MSRQTEFNPRFYLFLMKASACFFGLLLGFFILSPKASMQDDAPPPMPISANTPVVVVNGRIMGNYKPTPEPPKSTIRGRVIYADTGRPVRRAGLMLMSAKGSSGGRENAGLTNERGEFEIKNVTEGRYFVSVSTPGVLTPFSSLSTFERIGTAQGNSELADVAKDFQEVVVNGISDVDVTIVVRRGAAISGRIMYADGEPAIGMRVEILRKKGGEYTAVVSNISEIFGAIFGGAAGGMKTDDRGVFRVAGLPAGEYIVRVVENVSHSEKGQGRDDEFMAISGFNPTSMVATYYPNASDVKKAEVLKIELGQEQSEVNITIPERSLHNLSGVVINKATREPLKNARISIKSDNDVNSLFSNMPEFGSKNEADEQGRWSYKELPAGKYTLIVQPSDSYESSDETKPQKAKTPKLAKALKEIVIANKDVTDLVVELGYGATVSGTISFENQQAFSQSIFISATDEKEKFSESAFVYSQHSDNGKPVPKKIENFTIQGIPAGKVFLSVSNGGGRSDSDGEQEFYVKSILFGGKDIVGTTLETKEGEELKGVQIILSKDVGKLKGKVSKADKSPAIGAKISFIPIDKGKWGNLNTSLFASTNSDGEFEISGAPGEYFVVFVKDYDFANEKNKDKSPLEQKREWLEKEITKAQKVTIKAKEMEKITLTLPEK
ncbi:MAG: carboxypeptidase regulatory-like domain-containing protein [Acidobacteria bacterium]|nr:carboxypeptidase regulatory-like domain-containing protein [Acidobacteriota bacterium]MCA1637532.1 carboxypeptidase regulatory-like domain-containing protein [Acidobacteriota bacterium]